MGRPELGAEVEFSGKKGQLVMHLLDLDESGRGRLITHGVKTFLDAPARAPLRMAHELYWAAYRVPAGHRLALAIDTYDYHYLPPTVARYQVKLPLADEGANRLS